MKRKRLDKDKPKRPTGRPPKFTPEQLEKIAVKFEVYIFSYPDDKTFVPTLAEFGWRNNLTYDDMDNPRFVELKKKLIMRKEYQLMKGGLSGKFSAAMSIFMLKQKDIGYSDHQEIEHRGGVTLTVDPSFLPTPKKPKA